MLVNIDKKRLTDKIHSYYGYMRAYCDDYAERLICTLHSSLSDIVKAWIDGTEIPDTEFGEDGFAFQEILEMRETNDYPYAFEVLSTYVQDPVAGREKIWAKTHSDFQM